MRFGTRAFLWCFGPFALLMLGSFWDVQKLVQLTVRDGIRNSIRQSQEAIALEHSKSEVQNGRFLRILGENASLKAGLQLLLAERWSAEARRTVEDQLRETCETLGLEFLLVSGPEFEPVAGVMRVGDQLAPMDLAGIRPPRRGFLTVKSQPYQIASTPIDQGSENLGFLTIGERFDLSQFGTPAVLMHDGRVLKSSIPGVPTAAVERALASCPVSAECEVHLAGESYLSLPLGSSYFGGGYQLRSLQSLDSASLSLQKVLQNVFLVTGLGTLLATLILTALSSRSIGKPIAAVVSKLREAEGTGLLPEFETNGRLTPIHEMRELAKSFNRAGISIRQGRERLQSAYLEFVGSLANALDARDPYTAGHSSRVSEFACAIGRHLNMPVADLEDLRMGALLHDIGKIGIPDAVLQKSDRLTREEWSLIRQHPTIGRRILEGVSGFHEYLPIVELHHENWDGSGYPFGLQGEAVSLSARIVHVADAFDAMTSSRPYRFAMSPQEALHILQQNAGKQFDPAIVPVFVEIVAAGVVSAQLPEAKAVHSAEIQLV